MCFRTAKFALEAADSRAVTVWPADGINIDPSRVPSHGRWVPETVRREWQTDSSSVEVGMENDAPAIAMQNNTRWRTEWGSQCCQTRGLIVNSFFRKEKYAVDVESEQEKDSEEEETAEPEVPPQDETMFEESVHEESGSEPELHVAIAFLAGWRAKQETGWCVESTKIPRTTVTVCGLPCSTVTKIPV